MKTEYKAGDVIVITDAQHGKYFSVGDRAVLLDRLDCGCWHADFNQPGNSPVSGNFCWVVGTGDPHNRCNGAPYMFELCKKGTEV